MKVPKRGDWVIFSSSRGPELGRVWRYYPERNVCSVCYSRGCTPAMTSCELLRPYDPAIDADMVIDNRIGHHRFDAECPDYDPVACSGCREEER